MDIASEHRDPVSITLTRRAARRVTRATLFCHRPLGSVSSVVRTFPTEGNMLSLAKEDAELCGGTAQRRKEACLHIQHRHARSVATEIYGGDDAAVACVDRYSDGAKSNFEFLIAESVAIAADVAQSEAQLVDRVDGARRVLREDDAGEILFELVGWKVSEQDSSHTGTESW
jgi:hypothetical protein